MSGHFSEHVATLQNMHLSPTLIILAKATLAFPFCYHYASGIRHLVSIMFLCAGNLLSYGIIK
jgi:succinate dehydrogenase/fumarate reductase cytochrome b subunit